MNGDGALDGVCCGGGGGPTPQYNFSFSQFEISLGDGLGGFDAAFAIPSVGAPHIAAAEDLDGDGDCDLIAGLTVYYSRGGLRRPPSTDLDLAWWKSIRPQEVLDYDRDGDPDADFQFDRWLRNLGDGEFVETATLIEPLPPGESLGHPSFLGDWDGDGDEDFVVGHYAPGATEPTPRLLWNAGAGLFTLGGEAFAPGEIFDPSWENGYYREHLAVDVDADGDLDLVATTEMPASTSGATYTYMWFNDGSGLFSDTWYQQGQNMRAVEDLDQDGLPDIILAKNWSWIWRRNLGGGNFGAEKTIPGLTALDVGHDQVAIEDFDGDGDLDFFGLCWKTPCYTRNDGGGQFTHVPGILPDTDAVSLTGSDGTKVVGTDVNGDGLLDVVYYPVSWAYGTSYVHLATAPGQWGPATHLVARGTAAADVDGDGDPDLLGREVFFNTAVLPHQEGPRRQLGEGSPSTGGSVATLGASGTFIELGDPAALRLTGSVGGTVGLLAVGLVEASLPDFPFAGMTAWLSPFDPQLVTLNAPVSGTPGAPGEGDLSLPYAVTPGMLGNTFYHQVFVIEPALVPPLSATNGLRMRYGL